jgi:SAM-dependent methyltransferase
VGVGEVRHVNVSTHPLVVPPIDEFPSAYFAQHKDDVDTLLAHLRLFNISLGEASVVLELGAGTGMHTGFLSHNFGRVLATDIFKYAALRGGTFLQHVAAEHAKYGYPFHPEKIDFVTSSAMDLILKDDVADLGVSIDSFEHIPEPESALRELVRCVKPGGYVYLQFDPIWTADTGSHFSQYVAEPWGHLIYDTALFVEKMRTAGAREYEISSFVFGINRKRVAYYRAVLQAGVRDGLFTVVHQTSPEQWSAVVAPEHLEHPFMQEALARGYTREELLLRGMRWILRVSQP